MTTLSELELFHRFVGDQLNNGGVSLSPEEVLDLWRAHHPTPEELTASTAAIEDVLADIAAGDAGRPAEDVFADIRRKYNISART